MLHTTTVISRSTPAPSFLRRWTSTLVFLKGTASLEICQIMELQSLMYMIIEPQEHDFIVIHSPTKARTKLSQCFFFSIFLFFSSQFSSNSTATFKHFGPLYPDQPLVKQKNRAFKIPECPDLACLDRLPAVSLCQNQWSCSLIITGL